jgi:hypothetical protein
MTLIYYPGADIPLGRWKRTKRRYS